MRRLFPLLRTPPSTTSRLHESIIFSRSHGAKDSKLQKLTPLLPTRTTLFAHTHYCLSSMPKPPPLPWPAHWYQGHYDIRCIVPHCGFVSDTNNLPAQWTQLHDHCEDTPGAEHALLEIMLRQSKCAYCNNGGPYWPPKHRAIRALSDHESHAHGSATMFNISSFVVLARERRILFSNGSSHMAPEPNCERLTFDRMMEKVRALPPAELGLLFQKSGYHPGEYTAGNLAAILTYDPAAQPQHNAPRWLPVRADRFLSFCRPHGNDPADGNWRRVWRSLRDAYTDGRI